MKLTPSPVDSFIGHTASGNGGVMTTTGNAPTSIQVTDMTVENSRAVLGGAFEVISSAFSCTRCVLTDSQASAESYHLSSSYATSPPPPPRFRRLPIAWSLPEVPL